MASIQKIQTNGGTRWRMRVYIGRDPETGKRKYTTKTFDRKKDADAEATRLERQKDLGIMVVPSKEPLGKYLDRWLDDVMRGRVRARTWNDYKGVLRRYILEPPEAAPAIGNIRMDRVTGKAIQSLYAFLQHEEGLSPARSARCTLWSVRGSPTPLASVRRPGTPPRTWCSRRWRSGPSTPCRRRRLTPS